MIDSRVSEWTRPPFDEETIREILDLQESGNRMELEDRFYRTLEFGTGGLRGVIGAGSNRMNIYTVAMATQGLADYMLETSSRGRGIVIARDSRNKSDVFARETASIMAGNGIPVYFFQDIMPTPLASFAVRHLMAQAAVVITASHNPPEYNGYKVYWDDGGQIVPPHDNLIISRVENVTSPSQVKRMDFEEGLSSGLIRYIDDEVVDAYVTSLDKVMPPRTGHGEVSIVYTPLHGTGYRLVPHVLSRFGFNQVTLVDEQMIPDGSFPTVKSPNPEEKEAMTMALQLASRTGADIVLATDPDADRMGVGFRTSSGTYELINGNQIGCMLEAYILARMKETGTLPPDGIILKTIVTTELQREIAAAYRCRTVDVLTGFKWIAAAMKMEEDAIGGTFIFGGEESYGYLPVSFVRDKDAVSSILFFAGMTDWLRSRGMSLQEFLDSIYLEHSLHRDSMVSLTLKGRNGQERIKRIMSVFRATPPSSLAGITLAEMRDILELKTHVFPGDIVRQIDGLPSSDVIQFILVDGSRVTIRPSGTEPKIKFYFNVNTHVMEKELEEGKRLLDDRIDMLREDLLALIDGID